MYLKSTRLQDALCEYFVIIVNLCKEIVLFVNQSFHSQLSFSILKPFESEFGTSQRSLETIARAVREEVSLVSKQAQDYELKESSRFRALVSDTALSELQEARKWRKQKAKSKFLDACSIYNHRTSWKQAPKQGNVRWIFNNDQYKRWKHNLHSSTLWCTGILGSGKTVLSANIVENLVLTTLLATISYFFCRYDDAESLKARTIMGSIARQLFEGLDLDFFDITATAAGGIFDIDQLLDYLQEHLPSPSKKHYFVVIDGLDECEEKEVRSLMGCLKKLLTSGLIFQLYCSSRPDVLRWIPAILQPQWNVSMSDTVPEIAQYIEITLEQCLESGSLCMGDPAIIFNIQEVLAENAHGILVILRFKGKVVGCMEVLVC